jgi:hypothetical protein
MNGRFLTVDRGATHNPFVFIENNLGVMVTVTVFPPGGNLGVMVTVADIIARLGAL